MIIEKEIYPGITLYENFLTEDECDYILSLAKNISEKDWRLLYEKNAPSAYNRDKHDQDPFWADKVAELSELIKKDNLNNYNIISDINERIKKYILKDNEWHSFLNRVQRQYSGTALPNHFDNSHSENIIGAVIIYLNDDYVDGELVFDQLGIEIKPPKRSLIKFIATEKYTHETKVVGDGPLRLVLATFTWNNEESSIVGK